MTNLETLDEAKKTEFSGRLNDLATLLGGKFEFLSLIENLKEKSPHAVLAKHCEAKFDKGAIKWNKVVYPQNFEILLARTKIDEAILPKEGEKNYKKVLNMVKALSVIEFRVTIEKETMFTFKMFDEGGELDFVFETLFLRHPDFAKKLLSYKGSK